VINKIFKDDNELIIMVNDTRGELDKYYNNFLSSSLSSETLILTNFYSLLQEHNKFEHYIKCESEKEIITQIKNIIDKTIFVDVYINFFIPYNSYQRFLEKLKYYINENNLKIILIAQISNQVTIARPLLYGADSVYVYDTDKKMLFNHKNRSNQALSIDIRNWEKLLRNEKIKRLIKIEKKMKIK